MRLLRQHGRDQTNARTALSFTVSLTVGVVSFLGAGFAILAFVVWPAHREITIFVSGAIAAAGTVTAAVYAGRSLELSARQQKARLEEEKRLAALRFVEQWNSPSFFHGKKTWRGLMRRIVDDKSADRVEAVRHALSATEDEDTAETNLLEVLNFLEGLALAVRVGAVDQDTASDFFKTIVSRTYRHLEDWIKERRREVGPRVYQELEALYGWWKT